MAKTARLNTAGSNRGITQWIRWIARIWGGIVLLVALLIFAGTVWSWLAPGGADPHAAEEYAPIENVPPLLMFVAALGLGIAWRWEGLGGAITIASELAALPVLLVHWPIGERFPRYLIAPYGLWAVVAIPGLLFLISWWRSREPTTSGIGG
jgi:hypothetical protein